MERKVKEQVSPTVPPAELVVRPHRHGNQWTEEIGGGSGPNCERSTCLHLAKEVEVVGNEIVANEGQKNAESKQADCQLGSLQQLGFVGHAFLIIGSAMPLSLQPCRWLGEIRGRRGLESF